MKTSEILRAAKAKIAYPSRWCKGVIAKDSNGKEVVSGFGKEHNAVQFCSTGAVFYSGTIGTWRRTMEAANFLDTASGLPHTDVGSPRPAARFNDTHTHPEVLEMFDRAIQLAEEAGQ
jgi:hypothetical protein